MNKKRFLAYIIDMLILGILVMILRQIFPKNIYTSGLNELNQVFLEEKIDKISYFNQYQTLLHQIDKQDFGIHLCTTFLMILLFIIVPYLTKGQTIGQKIMKIKIVADEDVTMEQLVGRSVIHNGLGYMFFMLILLYLTNDKTYFIFINIFAFLQILVVIISGFMVLYKEEHLALADILTKTRIEEIS